jgi:putative tryptophan/tyrosine transport system substrate-binding protein
MRRREFITLLSGAAAAWPLAARAQQPERMRRVGVLLGLAEQGEEAKLRVQAFRLGLRDLGWNEGRNVVLDYRYGASDLGLIKQYVKELVDQSPDVIVGNSSPVLAALHQATTSIPIVFAVVNDPVGQGFISSLARPGGNITGFSFLEFEMVGKWINMLTGVVPNLRRVVLMFNPITAPYYDAFLRSFKATKQPSLAEAEARHVGNAAEIDLTIAMLGREPGSGLIAPGDPFIVDQRDTIIKSTDKHHVPVISPYRQFVIEGGLISYGPDPVDIFRRASSYVDRILKGETPATLPVQSPVKYQLIVNLKTAKSLGLAMIPSCCSPTRSSNRDAICCGA